MRTWIANLWLTFSSGFWFIPGLMMLAGVALAIGAPEFDRQTDNLLPASLRVTGETARATLSALCGAMITVTGVVFSTTTVAISITSTQLGPRLLRNFLGQQITQLTLGVCLATSVYCLVLLRRIDEIEGSLFVPNVSLLLASGLGIVTLMAIVYFIHRIAHSMQAQNVASDVGDDLDDAIRRLFPERIGHDAEEEDEARIVDRWREAWSRFDEGACVVEANNDGYLQAIDDDSLIEVAGRLEGWLRVRSRPGDYVRAGQTLVEVLPADAVEDSDQKKLRRCFLLGNLRTTQQDVECAVNELVEIALRALSPGINDPFTAVTCIDRLSGALRRLAERRLPTGLRVDDGGEARIVVKPRTFADVTDAAFNQLRQHSRGNVAVTTRLLEAIEAIGVVTTRRDDRAALQRQAEMILAAANAEDLTEDDLADIHESHRRATVVLTPELPHLLGATVEK